MPEDVIHLIGNGSIFIACGPHGAVALDTEGKRQWEDPELRSTGGARKFVSQDTVDAAFFVDSYQGKLSIRRFADGQTVAQVPADRVDGLMCRGGIVAITYRWPEGAPAFPPAGGEMRLFLDGKEVLREQTNGPTVLLGRDPVIVGIVDRWSNNYVVNPSTGRRQQVAGQPIFCVDHYVVCVSTDRTAIKVEKLGIE